MHQMETKGTIIPSFFPPYIPTRKSDAKPVKDLKDMKFDTFTLLLPTKVSFHGDTLGKIFQLKMEDWDFHDRRKYLQFESRKYLTQVCYPESRVTRLELQ